MTPFHEHEDLRAVPDLDALPDGAFDLVGIDAARDEGLAPLMAGLRRKVHHRRLRRGAALAAVYLVGVFTSQFVVPWGQQTSPEESVTSQVVASHQESPQQASLEDAQPVGADPLRESDPREPDPREPDPRELRRQVAGARPPEQRRLLRAAGDLYLSRYDDVQSAIHCYQQLLELETAYGESEPQSDDSWLLANLRLSREPFLIGESN